MSIDQGLALVGSPGDDDNGQLSGAVYLFDIATGAQLAKITPKDSGPGQFFGRSVAMSSGKFLVGAPLGNAGSAYLFDLSTGVQLAKLAPSDGALGDVFGSEIAIDRQTALIGAFRHDAVGLDVGSAYLFNVVPEPTTVMLAYWAAVPLTMRRRGR